MSWFIVGSFINIEKPNSGDVIDFTMYRNSPIDQLKLNACRTSLIGCCWFLLVATPLPCAAQPALTGPLSKFVNNYCVRCHGPEEQKGEFRIDQAPSKLTDPRFVIHWGKVLERLTSGEMPPQGESQPAEEDRGVSMQLISNWIREADAARNAVFERVSLRRLTRDEYANTVRDLLGATYVPSDPGNLPEEPTWYGFDRIGPALSLSPSHLERYLSAAESALEQVFPSSGGDTAPRLDKWPYHKIVGGNTDQSPEARTRGRKVVKPNSNLRATVNDWHSQQIPVSGNYRVRIKLSGLRPPGGNSPHVRFYCANLNRVLHEQDVEAPEDKPTIVEFTTYLPAGEHQVNLFNTEPGLSLYETPATESDSVVFLSIKEGREPTLQKITDEQGVPLVPFLLVDSIEFEGPMRTDLPAVLKGLSGDGPQDADQARQIVTAFAEKAFRRPLQETEAPRLSSLIDRELEAGRSLAQATRSALVAVLCSKNFIFLVEGDAETPRTNINDWELASRLSYFFWSTMPDEPLLQAARDKVLHEPDVLIREVRRMLSDPRASRFATTFPYQWLQLADVGKFPPDKKLYPNYSKTLEQSMIAETTSFFGEMLDRNLSIREFLISNWTMMNGPLAKFYEMPGIVDAPVRRVTLPSDSPRGGVLTQAAVLSLTSDGARHRPVHRGKWVLESILGQSPPRPPPNVAALPVATKDQPRQTIREKLGAHVTNESCATCHSQIDPLGLAFENFDAIGAWRDVEIMPRGTGETRPVDASGKLPDGRVFSTPNEFKELLAANLDPFALTLAEKLATYAMRRPLTLADRESLCPTVMALKDKGYRLRDLIEAITLNPLFLRR